MFNVFGLKLHCLLVSALLVLGVLCRVPKTEAAATACVGGAPAPGFTCEPPNWAYRGDFSYNGPSGLVFAGASIVYGNFSFISTSSNFVTFSYNAHLLVMGTAVFDDGAAWKILLTPAEARDLWTHQSDRNVTYVQASKLLYNSEKVATVSSDACTRISGRTRTSNVTNNGIVSELLVVEFTDFKSYATCKVWWVIPLVIGIVLSIVGIALFCYFRGRNKEAEGVGYVRITDPDNPPTASIRSSEEQIN